MEKSRGNEKEVIVYIDGFNLYNGLKDQGWRKYYWLDVTKLASALLTDDQRLVVTRYYTTRIAHPYEKQKRQSIYIDALETLADLSITYGKFQKDNVTCERCGAIVHYDVEKQTDVNIASDMLVDASEGKFDVAILVSGDSDLCSPIRNILRLYPQKMVIAAFPPMRQSAELADVATKGIDIFKRAFKMSLLPAQLASKKGYLLNQPIEWQ